MGLWVPDFDTPRPDRSNWPAPWLPGWEPTYNMSLSTIMQPCNYSGYLEPEFASKFGLVDIDWANGLELWSNHAPMDSEALMVEQARQLKLRNPAQKVFVYRNLVQAYSWFGGSVLDKLQDPQYSGFFLPFRPDDGTNTSSPRCDAANSSLCSHLYHSQTLAPKSKGAVTGWSACNNFSTCDGFCRSGQCDCGTVPCGSYVFDHRSVKMAAAFTLISAHLVTALLTGYYV
jgi:hypothetical protein